MNTNPRKSNFSGLLLLALFVVALLAACSGGSIDVSIGGVSFPPGTEPPFPNSEPVAAQGTITGFGDLRVNGVRYDTGSASVMLDEHPGTLSDLKIGHVVTLSGWIGTTGFSGQAMMIRMHSRLIGPVQTIDVANARMTAMGQTIRLGSQTNYPANIDPATLDGLEPGDRIRVSGYADAAGNVRATRVEMAGAGLPLQVVGKVSGLDSANLVFDINQLTIDYGNAAVIDLPGGSPANGMTIRVIGTFSNNLFVAEQLLSGPALSGNVGQRVQLGGLVTRFASLADFDVNDSGVSANSSTAFSNGDSGDLQLNAEVTVDGTFGGGADIRADRVTFGQLAGNTTTLVYDLVGFTRISVPTVFGISVTQGAEYSVEVLIDEEDANRVDVSMNGSTLTISLQSGNGQIETIHARVTMPVLERIDLTGVVNARLYDFDQAQMTINVGNVSNLSGDGLRIGQLQATVSGVSRLDLGNIRPIGQADIAISGVSQATLNMDVGSRLSGSISTGQGTGASTLYYYGTNVMLDVAAGNNTSVVRLGETKP